MTTYAYREVLNEVVDRFLHLTPDDQRRLLKDLEALVPDLDTEDEDENEEPIYNITEFKGFAEELWKGVDVEKYINEERNSWDG